MQLVIGAGEWRLGILDLNCISQYSLSNCSLTEHTTTLV